WVWTMKLPIRPLRPLAPYYVLLAFTDGAAIVSGLDKPGASKEGPRWAELRRVGRGHGRARRPVNAGGCPAHPTRNALAGASAAAPGGGPATAASPADQRGWLADRCGRAGCPDGRGLRPRAARLGGRGDRRR